MSPEGWQLNATLFKLKILQDRVPRQAHQPRHVLLPWMKLRPPLGDGKEAVGCLSGPWRTFGLSGQGSRTVRAKKLDSQQGLTNNVQSCWSVVLPKHIPGR